MYTCVIIDDDALAINVLKNHIGKIGFLDVVASFTNPILALNFLEKTPIDLIFIDIQMPGITGLELITRLKKQGKFIITSAYREYAIDGFDLDVLDFVGKPVSFERLLKGVSKLVERTIQPSDQLSSGHKFIFIKVNKKMIKVPYNDIIFIESKRVDLNIVCDDCELTTRGTISYYEDWLPKSDFLRVHRSFIISISKINYYNDGIIEMKNEKKIPIGEMYSKSFKEAIQKHLI